MGTVSLDNAAMNGVAVVVIFECEFNGKAASAALVGLERDPSHNRHRLPSLSPRLGKGTDLPNLRGQRAGSLPPVGHAEYFAYS